jgi:hypothetical protein
MSVDFTNRYDAILEKYKRCIAIDPIWEIALE